jgi:hypothetical protein
LALRADLLDLEFNKMKSWWKRATRAETATELTGAEINRLAAELQVLAGRRGVTTGAAVTAIATALGNEVAALVMRNPSLTIDEISDMVCQSVREMAHVAANPQSPDAPKDGADLTEQEFAQLTIRIIYTATHGATLTDATAATARALGVLIANMARRPGVGFDETLRWAQNDLVAFAREARDTAPRNSGQFQWAGRDPQARCQQPSSNE